ncbi:MAG: integrase arm-type DNA-binding domain-containing protein [Oceanospirillaceae bacterium]|nr:integrase arm-type DNA-binding domain-containing protein [Oceanospirillaceae bacterium]
MSLTDVQLRNVKPKAKPYRLTDSQGLYAEVHPNGSVYWRMKYRFDGKEKRLAIGVYPRVGLKDARKSRDDAKALLELGLDPSTEKRKRKAQHELASASGFEYIAREWHAKQAKLWSVNYAEKVERAMERDLIPYLSGSSIDQISAPDLLSVLRRVEKRGAVETAHRLMQIFGQIAKYAVSTGRAQRDMTPDLKGALATPKRYHFSAITEPPKVGRLLQMIDGYQGTPTVRAALRLAPLVFVRPKELRYAEWCEIDVSSAEWRIPASKMKMNQDHIVPLSRQAIEILEEQKLLTGHWGGFVFPSARSARRPMSDNAILSAFRNMGIYKEEMTGHGFRAMARTILDEVLGERVDLIEHQLAHAVKDSLGRAYNRTTHLPQRRLMMQRWADYLDALRATARNRLSE